MCPCFFVRGRTTDCSTKFLRIDTPPEEIREMLKVEKTD